MHCSGNLAAFWWTRYTRRTQSDVSADQNSIPTWEDSQTAPEITKIETSMCFPSLTPQAASTSKHPVIACGSKYAWYFAVTVTDRGNFWDSHCLASVTLFLMKCLPVVPAKKTQLISSSASHQPYKKLPTYYYYYYIGFSQKHSLQ